MAVRAAKALSTKLVWGEDLHRTYTSVYQVISSFGENPKNVANASGIPAYGASYIWDSITDVWAFTRSIDVSPKEHIADSVWSAGAQIWHCSVKHSSKASTTDTSEKDNPLNNPPLYSGSFAPYMRNMFRDKDGEPLVNSAGFPLEPTLQIPDAYDTLRIKFNTATINLATRNSFINKVNSTVMWGLKVRQVKLTAWGYEQLFAGSNSTYIGNSLEFLISYRKGPSTEICGTGPNSALGWWNTTPNIGKVYYENGVISDVNKRVFSDSRDEVLSEPGQLGCDGDKLDPAATPKFLVNALEEEINLLSIPGLPATFPNPPFVTS